MELSTRFELVVSRLPSECFTAKLREQIGGERGTRTPTPLQANGFLDRGSANYAYLSIKRSVPDEPTGVRVSIGAYDLPLA